MEKMPERLSMENEQLNKEAEKNIKLFNIYLGEFIEKYGPIQDQRRVELAQNKFIEAMHQTRKGANDITEDYEAQKDVVFSALKEGVTINKVDSSAVGRDAKKARNVFNSHGEVPPEAKKPLPWSRSLH